MLVFLYPPVIKVSATYVTCSVTVRPHRFCFEAAPYLLLTPSESGEMVDLPQIKALR